MTPAVLSVAFVALFALGCLAVVASEGGPRKMWRTFSDGIRWSLFRLRHPEDAWAYGEHGLRPYAAMRRARARGWVASTIEDAVVARMHYEVRTQGSVNRTWVPNVRRALLVMTPESVGAFSAATCDVWVGDPVTAQEWFDALGRRAPHALQAGLSLAEAVALDGQGLLDDEALATLVALRTSSN